MLRFLCLVSLCLFLSFTHVFVQGAYSAAVPQSLEKSFIKVMRQGTSPVVLHVEIADSEDERSIGMMYRRAVPQNTGMLFLFQDNQERFFWMKNTYMSLDILFLDQQGRVHHIHAGAEPHNLDRISSHGKSVAVLELGAGEAERLNIRVGDYIEYSDFFTTGQ